MTKSKSWIPNHKFMLVLNLSSVRVFFFYLFGVLGFSFLLFLDFKYSAERYILNSCFGVSEMK